GPQPWVVYLANCVLGALSCLLAYLLARDLLGGEGPARLAGVLTALYWPHIWFATVFVSENLYVPCQALVVWLVVRLGRPERAGRWDVALVCLAGLLLGWAVLTRPFALLLVPLLPAVLLSAGWRQPHPPTPSPKPRGGAGAEEDPTPQPPPRSPEGEPDRRR